MRKIPLHVQLVLVVAGAIIPLAAMCGLGIKALSDSQAEQNKASIGGIARAMASAVDAEIQTAVAALQSLAMSEALTEPSGAGQERALSLSRAVRGAHTEWRGILVSDPAGRVVFATDDNLAQGSQVNDLVSHSQVVSTGRPAVGAMTRGPKGNLAFPIRVPVLRGEQVRFVLTAVVRTEAVATVLKKQQVPEGWNISVFDGNALRVARAIGDEVWRGRPPSESLQALLNQLGDRQDLVGTSKTVEGAQVSTAIARLGAAPWTLVLGASTAVADGSRSQSQRAYLVGLVASLLLGGLGAWAMSRAITAPMRGLREDADALGQGRVVRPRTSNITEIDAVARALASASTQRKANEEERERLYLAEREARSIAQAAESRLTQLLNAGALLSRSLEEASTLAAIASVIVPDIGDFCRIDLLDQDGRLQSKLFHHIDPTRGAELDEFSSTRSTWADSPGFFLWAIQTGKTFVYNVEDPDSPVLTDPGMVEFVHLLDVKAGCVVPLVARGHTIGAMAVLQTQSNRRFSAADSAMIGELAQRVALALDNAQLLAGARESQREAEVSNRTKDEFLAMLGHELRNPLAPISLALQLMAKRDIQAFVKEREIIARQVKHLSRMVDDLLDISRIVSGKVSLALEEVDLREPIQLALESTEPLFESRASKPKLMFPSKTLTVLGDPIRLAQIVSNLLTNAAKFSPSDAEISITLREVDGVAEFSVSDAGIGIAADLLPRVFERFVQGEQALERAAGGLGLGLAIAQNLAKLHNGSIEAHSEGPGTGSTFIVRLPLDTSATSVAAPSASGHTASRTLNFLVVDDNKDAANMLAEWLESEGHSAEAVYSGEEAIVRLLNAPPDAAVLDIGMPGLSGYELARAVRSDPRIGDITLVALTGYGGEADRQHAIRAGFDDHFAKPADVVRMLEAIRVAVWAREKSRMPGTGTD